MKKQKGKNVKKAKKVDLKIEKIKEIEEIKEIKEVVYSKSDIGEVKKIAIAKLSLSTGRADLDSMVEKLNEIIDVLNN